MVLANFSNLELRMPENLHHMMPDKKYNIQAEKKSFLLNLVAFIDVICEN